MVARSRVAVLVVVLLAIAAGTGGGLWRLYVSHRLPALADSSPGPAPAPQVASREAAPATPPGTAQPTPSIPPASASDQAADHPSFDIVRVEPKGDTVVAGKGAPNTKVALMAGAKVVGEARTDANGQFVILPAPLPPGDYDLTLRQTPEGKPARESAQSVAVSVPRPGRGKAVVALAEPGKATRLLSGPPEAPGPATSPLPPGKVAIRSAELENGTGFFVSGAAQSGAPVHVYLNDAHIADVVAGADGAWSVRVKKGLTGGHYVVRADVGGADGRAVASRAEVPFDVPTAMAAATPGAANATTTSAPLPAPLPETGIAAVPAPGAGAVGSAATPGVAAATTAGPDATIDSLATTRVTTGDNLWNISRYRLGDGKRYTQIYAANNTQIRDPNLIYPGQVFVVPAR